MFVKVQSSKKREFFVFYDLRVSFSLLRMQKSKPVTVLVFMHPY
jgi:hypothetical protein